MATAAIVAGDLLVPLGLADSTYQPIDKVVDRATYIGMGIVCVVRYKLQDEDITHIGNFDRSDLIGRLYGR